MKLFLPLNTHDIQWPTAANLTANNNITSDSTADDYGGGAGCIVDVTATDEFVNISAGDFALSPLSLAIDAGATITYFNTDKKGVSRPQLTAWDIGSEERTSRGVDFSGSCPQILSFE